MAPWAAAPLLTHSQAGQGWKQQQTTKICLKPVKTHFQEQCLLLLAHPTLHLFPVGTVLLLLPDNFTAHTAVPHPGSNQRLGIKLVVGLLGTTAQSKHTSCNPTFSLKDLTGAGHYFFQTPPYTFRKQGACRLASLPPTTPFSVLSLTCFTGKKKSWPSGLWAPRGRSLLAPAWDPGRGGGSCVSPQH